MEGKYHYYIRNRGLELEYKEPNERSDGAWRAWGQMDRHPWGGLQNRLYDLIERDDNILQTRSPSPGES